MFDKAEFVNSVFEIAYGLWKASGQFTRESIFAEVNFDALSEEEKFYQQENLVFVLGLLTKFRVFSVVIKPSYTENLRLPLKTPNGKITKFGCALQKLPKVIRLVTFIYILQNQRLKAFLGVLAFVVLVRNAIIGAEIVSGWVEYLSVFILMYFFYLFMKKLTVDV